jgi:hypothetical protein
MGRWFQNDLMREDARAKLPKSQDNQGLIRQGPSIILWAGASAVYQLAIFDEVLEIESMFKSFWNQRPLPIKK